MKANVRLFFILGVFFVVACAIYTVWTMLYDAQNLATDPSGGAPQAQVEWVGTVGIGLTAILAFFIAFYLSRSHAAQGGELPEDRLDANIDDGDPELGFYSPWSWWPMVLALSAALGFTGLAVGVWITFIGVGIFAVAITGWVYEYYRGYHAH
ncbi:cytochrome c oxidase subunit 4 [Naasia lichenicola]|uniref:cytochrome-c oxidase n=1 Tax=Naasia lichenicola TaxID=2565933 RepID=A0A4S4FSZ4_9MICO|nr:cytochrome c oxidase subunit 4 [Naasia lichenicola]THG33438.1 cytochrome c oxidase subunit 4 [Naasia lichenicola]